MTTVVARGSDNNLTKLTIENKILVDRISAVFTYLKYISHFTFHNFYVSPVCCINTLIAICTSTRSLIFHAILAIHP